MTWQRIDENTYIDDSLVTCAEYQLFIDEMREKGKYYQPDHWTSHQFPEGQALKPILGVRHSDAVAFCVWLTKRETREWNYRLAKEEEANAFSIKHLEQSLLGYWIGKDNDQSRYVWIEAIPLDARNLDLEIGIDRFMSTVKLYSTRVMDHSVVGVFIDRVIRDWDIVKNRSHEHKAAITQAYSDFQSLTKSLETHHTIAHDYWLRDDFALANILSINVPEKDFDQIVTEMRQLAIGISSDLFALQERIAGRSHAFEGIRLVKERIR